MKKGFFKSGDAWIWLNAGAVSVCLLMIVGILGLIAVRGLSHFWPAPIMQANYVTNGTTEVIVGEVYDEKVDPAKRLMDAGQPLPVGAKPEDEITRYSMKLGNKDITGQDFKWVVAPLLQQTVYPKELYKVERIEQGNLYGRLQQVMVDGKVTTGAAAHAALEQTVSRANTLREQLRDLEKGDIGAINHAMETLRLHERKLELNGKLDPKAQADIEKERAQLSAQFTKEQQKIEALNAALNRDTAQFVVANGQTVDVPLSKIVEPTQPNAMNIAQKAGHFFKNIWVFLSGEPRESNTEGGVFPAIFGTITMVFLMTIFVTPLGVIAAVYLREYASQGRITQIVRIAVNNLAGVPSIVYGVFGLGFFVYVLGGSIDRLFYPESAPQPVFGTPGLLWASITLALLTLPVVIVATEEGLTRIPRALKEGSLALGATKAETLWRVVLPMAAPSIMTGMILAIARAAGEVAPLMLVGVVKLAQSLPIDTNAPFVHLEQKFMHLGFHIYDVGFQSPNVEASRPLVYATALLLVSVVAILNLAAVALRNRMREKFKALEH